MDIIETKRHGTLISRVEIDQKNRRLRRLAPGDKGGLELVEERDLTDEDLEDLRSEDRERSERGRVRADIKRNKDFLTQEKPTAAQTAAQVKALTRQVNSLLERQKDQYR